MPVGRQHGQVDTHLPRHLDLRTASGVGEIRLRTGGRERERESERPAQSEASAVSASLPYRRLHRHHLDSLAAAEIAGDASHGAWAVPTEIAENETGPPLAGRPGSRVRRAANPAAWVRR